MAHFKFRYEDIVYDQTEHYFVVRVDSMDVSKDQWRHTEHNEIKQLRWWRLHEIAASNQAFRPGQLAVLLAPVLAGDYPEKAVPVQMEASAITEAT
jgi:hypothetical protein